MNKNKFEQLVNAKIDKTTKINFYRKIKLKILLNEVQKSIIDAINLKNMNNEIINLEIELSEREYLNFFGDDSNKKISEKYFFDMCSENRITCNLHHVKYNTQIFNSYYKIIIQYNNPNYNKKLTLK